MDHVSSMSLTDCEPWRSYPFHLCGLPLLGYRQGANIGTYTRKATGHPEYPESAGIRYESGIVRGASGRTAALLDSPPGLLYDACFVRTGTSR